jgi:SAM-dependent methyltransferase
MKKITRKNIRPFLEKYCTTDLVLDIGGGKIETNHSYSDLFPNRHTFDVDPERKPDTVGDAHSLPFEDNSFGHIICTEVLEHLHTPQKAVDEMYRVLKPEGSLILTTRFVYPLHDVPNDYFRYTKYGLQHLFRNWTIEMLEPETSTFSALGALTQRVGFQTKLRGGKFTKAILYGLAFIFTKISWLLVEEYGDIQKKKIDDHILTTGYYLVSKK